MTSIVLPLKWPFAQILHSDNPVITLAVQKNQKLSLRKLFLHFLGCLCRPLFQLKPTEQRDVSRCFRRHGVNQLRYRPHRLLVCWHGWGTGSYKIVDGVAYCRLPELCIDCFFVSVQVGAKSVIKIRQRLSSNVHYRRLIPSGTDRDSWPMLRDGPEPFLGLRGARTHGGLLR